MTFRPLHDRVLVKRVEEESKTAGGIIIPDTAKEKPQEGEVVSVGGGAIKDDGSATLGGSTLHATISRARHRHPQGLAPPSLAPQKRCPP